MPIKQLRVLFVCTGNICRSPIAERMLEATAVAEGLDLDVGSAGTRALNGRPMHPDSTRVLRERGLRSDGFQSRLLTTHIATESDLVLGLTREHRAVARQLAPIRWKRMYALRELSCNQDTLPEMSPTDSRLDIADPIGRSPAVFDQVATEIESSISTLIAWIGDFMELSQETRTTAK